MPTIRAFSDDLITVSGPAFIVTDQLGDIEDGTYRGLFVADTRYLARYLLRLNGVTPFLLRAGSVGPGETQIYATNRGLDSIADQSLDLVRRRSVDSGFSEEIVLTNHNLEMVEVELSFALDADFADIFEVRGYLSDGPTERGTAQVSGRRIEYSYLSSENRWQTDITFSRQPDTMTTRLATFNVQLAAGKSWQLDIRIECTRPASKTTLPAPVAHMRIDGSDPAYPYPTLQTDDQTLQLAYDQSIRDLQELEFALSNGESILAAGIPWYLAIFGRDAIISSLQILSIAPHIAVGTLRTLAAYQATDNDAFRDAEPGKIPHEIRFGPLSESSKVPHARYYGTVDATPLWLILLAATWRWTGDTLLIEEMLPAAERALHWIDTFGDNDGDGFVEYRTRSSMGLANQGWKDSWNSIRFADGRLADAPIALVEVQGYVFAAKNAMAEIYEAIGKTDDAAALRAQAIDLKRRVHEAFWMPAEQCYAMALDAKKQQVDGMASNQGHLLWAGLPDPEFGNKIVDRLMASDCFSGWGIRTLASSMMGYNPIGYHIGSVWPHDTALIAAGFRRVGRHTEAAMLIDGMIDATRWFDRQRLPELFGGWDRRETPFPIDCPVACSPQAWSAGAIIMMLIEMAGIGIDNGKPRVDPMATDRTMKLSGVPFKDDYYTIDIAPDGRGSAIVQNRSSHSSLWELS